MSGVIFKPNEEEMFKTFM